ncbi:MAG: RloB family protein, partial [Victivallales bacterium]
LIVCEGEKTEPNYFTSFSKELPKALVTVEIEGEGKNTLSLVESAKEMEKKSLKTSTPYDKVWVVFDCDSFKAKGRFDNAIKSAKAAGLGCAWSNEAFELWYLLHFEYRNTAMSRANYKSSLSRHLGETYKKNDPDMYGKLITHQVDAVKNSELLLMTHRGMPASRSNPATTVHLLVNELNEYLINPSNSGK